MDKSPLSKLEIRNTLCEVGGTYAPKEEVLKGQIKTTIKLKPGDPYPDDREWIIINSG